MYPSIEHKKGAGKGPGYSCHVIELVQNYILPDSTFLQASMDKRIVLVVKDNKGIAHFGEEDHLYHPDNGRKLLHE